MSSDLHCLQLNLFLMEETEETNGRQAMEKTKPPAAAKPKQVWTKGKGDQNVPSREKGLSRDTINFSHISCTIV